MSKTHEARTVIVPNRVIERIERLLADRDPNEFVFSAPWAVAPGNTFVAGSQPGRQSRGIPDLVPHDLRDTAASLAPSAGASIRAVQSVLAMPQHVRRWVARLVDSVLRDRSLRVRIGSHQCVTHL